MRSFSNDNSVGVDDVTFLSSSILAKPSFPSNWMLSKTLIIELLPTAIKPFSTDVNSLSTILLENLLYIGVLK